MSLSMSINVDASMLEPSGRGLVGKCKEGRAVARHDNYVNCRSS